ncbi:MAG: DUF58 domain-containing protein [Myxococcales bacterium]|nr:DUF58 domain-containing protein [Myxococcales bacterium]
MGTELLDAVALSRLADLKLRARTVVEGALAGLHRSPHHGASVEFAEHKEYSPGDEVRRIDWKAYGKFDKYYIKRYEEETELRGYLVIDCSASMGYAGKGVSKLAYATYLAAALAYLMLRQQDQAGLVAFAETLRAYLPPRSRSGHLGDLLDALGALEAKGKTDLPRAMAYVSDVARRRSLIVLFSDLLETGYEAVHLLRGLKARRHDVVLFHVLDSDELTLPFEGPTEFEGMEDDERLVADPEVVRAQYLAEITRFTEGCKRGCAEGDVEYHLCDTARPPSAVLLDFLRARGRGRR